jgi:hypothetical protein
VPCQTIIPISLYHVLDRELGDWIEDLIERLLKRASILIPETHVINENGSRGPHDYRTNNKSSLQLRAAIIGSLTGRDIVNPPLIPYKSIRNDSWTQPCYVPTEISFAKSAGIPAINPRSAEAINLHYARPFNNSRPPPRFRITSGASIVFATTSRQPIAVHLRPARISCSGCSGAERVPSMPLAFLARRGRGRGRGRGWERQAISQSHLSRVNKSFFLPVSEFRLIYSIRQTSSSQTSSSGVREQPLSLAIPPVFDSRPTLGDPPLLSMTVTGESLVFSSC